MHPITNIINGVKGNEHGTPARFRTKDLGLDQGVPSPRCMGKVVKSSEISGLKKCWD